MRLLPQAPHPVEEGERRYSATTQQAGCHTEDQREILLIDAVNDAYGCRMLKPPKVMSEMPSSSSFAIRRVLAARRAGR